jgi:cysteine desulfurase
MNIYFPGKKDLIFKLDMAGFAVSGGSACSARLAKPSHVLKAMGLSDEKASESIRVSFGRQTDKPEIGKLLAALKNIIYGGGIIKNKSIK